MKNLLLTGLLVMILSMGSFARSWILNGEFIDVLFHENEVALVVIDKRTNQAWTQFPSGDRFKVTRVRQRNNQITATVQGEFSFTLEIRLLEKDGLEISVNAPQNAAMNDFRFPGAFQTPGKNNYLIHTDGEGFLLDVADTIYPVGYHRMYSMDRGLSMAWMGMTTKEFGSGYMAIIDTPEDAGFYSFRKDGLIAFEPRWLPVKGRFGYNRVVRYHFFHEEGYVAQAKKYREYIWPKNNVPSLKEKEKRQPGIAKMIGAPHVYLWDDARDVSFLSELKESGIEKAFIFWDPSHLPYPVKGYDNYVREKGYLSGVYELFRDVHLKDTIVYERKGKDKEMTLDRYSYPGLYHDIVLIQKDGSTHYSGFGYDVCPKAIYLFIPSLRVERELADYPHDSYFVDAYMASGLFECYHPGHPLTRKEYKQSVIDIHNLFAGRYNQIVGAEWGGDYGVPYAAYAQGMTTLHTMLYYADSLRWIPGNIHYMGNWDNNERPSMMLGAYTATDVYHTWALNETIRVPLYQLVYHDAIVTTWRWDDANHHMPEVWWKKDLFNVLYGTAPIWSMDKSRWESFKTDFVSSYRNLSPLLQEIGYDEMMSHRFISPDRTVQETVFSGGKTVVVNFGKKSFEIDGKVLAAGDFLVFVNGYNSNENHRMK